MIRTCLESDFEEIYEIINDSAEAYRGVIPGDCWHEPYMSRDELSAEIRDGIVFYVAEIQDRLEGVMGIQDKGPVTLIRHAYVRTAARKQGIGTELLHYLEQGIRNPILIGTWAAADWAVRFYQKNGYRLVTLEEKDRLLKKFWNIPDRQVETSVVLANKHPRL
jgi:GNAT superfamily N-acetyltransferase